MIILFANQKGGVGKSTLATLLANYLSIVNKREVIVFDMDSQRSILNKSKTVENKPLYQVKSLELNQFTQIHDLVNKNESLVTIIDTAGSIENDGLIPIFQCADVVICPFSYDEFSVSATIEFSYIIKSIREMVDIVFIPNRVKSTVKYATLESVYKVLSNFGVITQPITERIDFQRIDTCSISSNLMELITPVFNSIEQIFTKK